MRGPKRPQKALGGLKMLSQWFIFQSVVNKLFFLFVCEKKIKINHVTFAWIVHWFHCNMYQEFPLAGNTETTIELAYAWILDVTEVGKTSKKFYYIPCVVY